MTWSPFARSPKPVPWSPFAQAGVGALPDAALYAKIFALVQPVVSALPGFPVTDAQRDLIALVATMWIFLEDPGGGDSALRKAIAGPAKTFVLSLGPENQTAVGVVPWLELPFGSLDFGWLHAVTPTMDWNRVMEGTTKLPDHPPYPRTMTFEKQVFPGPFRAGDPPSYEAIPANFPWSTVPWTKIPFSKLDFSKINVKNADGTYRYTTAEELLSVVYALSPCPLKSVRQKNGDCLLQPDNPPPKNPPPGDCPAGQTKTKDGHCVLFEHLLPKPPNCGSGKVVPAVWLLPPLALGEGGAAPVPLAAPTLATPDQVDVRPEGVYLLTSAKAFWLFQPLDLSKPLPPGSAQVIYTCVQALPPPPSNNNGCPQGLVPNKDGHCVQLAELLPPPPNCSFFGAHAVPTVTLLPPLAVSLGAGAPVPLPAPWQPPQGRVAVRPEGVYLPGFAKAKWLAVDLDLSTPLPPGSAQVTYECIKPPPPPVKVPCKAGQIRDPFSGDCIKAPPPPVQCPPGQHKNAAGKCVADSPCPPGQILQGGHCFVAPDAKGKCPMGLLRQGPVCVPPPAPATGLTQEPPPAEPAKSSSAGTWLAILGATAVAGYLVKTQVLDKKSPKRR